MKKILIYAIFVMLVGCVIKNSPPTVELLKPKNGAFVQERTIELEWNAFDPENDSMKFDVYLYKVGSTPAKIDTTESTHTSVNVEPLSDYEWFVVAKDPQNISTSTVWRFSTGKFLSWTYIPTVTILENSTLVLNLNDYTISFGCFPLTFHLIDGPKDSTLTSTGIFYWITDYQSSGVHSVSVLATDSRDESASTSFYIKVFNVNRPPSTVTLLEPSNGSVRVFNDPTLVWTSQDPDVEIGEDSLTYVVKLWSDSTTTFETDSTSLKIENLDYSKTYYWKVIVYDSYGASAVSEVSSFTTEHGKIFLIPSSSPAVDENLILTVKSDGVPEISAIELELSFATKIFNLTDFDLSSVFSNGLIITSPLDDANESGKFSFAYARLSGTIDIDSHSLATLTFQVENFESTTAKFSLKLTALDGNAKEIPVGTRDLVINVEGGG